MIHLHLTAIVIAVVFFFITYFSIKNPGEPDAKYAKAPHMVARLFYVIVLVSGLVVFIQAMGINGMLDGLEFLAGLFTIGLMDVAVIKMREGTGQTLVTLLSVREI